MKVVTPSQRLVVVAKHIIITLCIFHFHVYLCQRKIGLQELTFFRQDRDPISVKCEDFKIPQVSNISWDVFNQITSQNLQKQKRTKQFTPNNHSSKDRDTLEGRIILSACISNRIINMMTSNDGNSYKPLHIHKSANFLGNLNCNIKQKQLTLLTRSIINIKYI